MSSRAAPVVLLGCLLTLPLRVAAQPSPDLQRLLALPLSPGSVAALVPHAADPGVQGRFAEALRDPRPEVREIAARLVFVTMSILRVNDVKQALEAEQDASAAAEMARVLATFDADASYSRLRDLAATRPPDVRLAIAEALARSHPALLARLVSEEGERDLVPATAVALASAQHPLERPALAKAALARGATLWLAFLAVMHDQMVPVDGPALRDGLTSAIEGVRTASALYVATLAGHPDDRLDRGALEAAADGAEQAAEPVKAWELAYRELARRATGRTPKRVDWAALFAADPPEERGRRLLDVNASLLGPERAEVEAIVGRPLAGTEWYRSEAARDHPRSRAQKTRTLAPSVARLLADLSSVFGCRRGDDDAFAAAEIFYRPDGRPKIVRPAESRLSGECAAVAHTAFQVTIASPRQAVLTGTSDGLFLPFSREYLACVDKPLEPIEDGPAGTGQVPPRPRSPFRYDYPKALRPFAVTGSVRVEALISSAGCARSVETLSSLHPLLDVETLRAVLSTPFVPMTVGGRPVASLAQVQLSFKP